MTKHMLIYSVTIRIQAEIVEDWFEWMTEKHIPEVMRTGCFTDFKMYKLWMQDEKEGPAYVIQYRCEDADDYLIYQRDFAPALQEEHKERFKNQFAAFRTLMEEIQ